MFYCQPAGTVVRHSLKRSVCRTTNLRHCFRSHVGRSLRSSRSPSVVQILFIQLFSLFVQYFSSYEVVYDYMVKETVYKVS
jgi:hypothetical protein